MYLNYIGVNLASRTQQLQEMNDQNKIEFTPNKYPQTYPFACSQAKKLHIFRSQNKKKLVELNAITPYAYFPRGLNYSTT